MKILLLGANGQVGWELRKSLAPLGHVVACARSAPPDADLHKLDITDTDALVAAIRAEKPSLIVNAAAYTAVDKAESDQAAAFAANATAPGVIAEQARMLGAQMVHYSTDYVFDGTKQGAYVETDAPNPQSVYGASKLAGEQAIAGSGADALIFRLSWVFGTHGNNFPKTMLRLARERDALSVVADQVIKPTPAALAAQITAHAIGLRLFRKRRAQIYHLAAQGITTPHAFALRTLSLANEMTYLDVQTSAEFVRAICTNQYPALARRPVNSAMETGKIETALDLELPHWDLHLRECVAAATLPADLRPPELLTARQSVAAL